MVCQASLPVKVSDLTRTGKLLVCQASLPVKVNWCQKFINWCQKFINWCQKLMNFSLPYLNWRVNESGQRVRAVYELLQFINFR